VKKYITKDKYEGLDPEIAELLKQGKMIKIQGERLREGKVESWLYDYIFGRKHPYKVMYFKEEYNCFVDTSLSDIEPILENEIDWANLPVDTLLEVSDREDFTFSKLRYFLSRNTYVGANIKCVAEGRTSKTMFSDDDWNSWKYARLVKEDNNV
jgi:hypothetical protein